MIARIRKLLVPVVATGCILLEQEAPALGLF
jgi:hypothetical protein